MEKFPLESVELKLVELTDTEIDAVAGGVAVTTSGAGQNFSASLAANIINVSIPNVATASAVWAGVSVAF